MAISYKIFANLKALNSTRDELGEQMQSNKKLAAALKQAREASGSAEKARERAQLIERLEAQTNTLASENQRLRQLAHREEDDRVEVEMKLSTLENAVLERNRRIELLQREVADKAERLRRFAERIDKI